MLDETLLCVEVKLGPAYTICYPRACCIGRVNNMLSSSILGRFCTYVFSVVVQGYTICSIAFLAQFHEVQRGIVVTSVQILL